MAELLTTIATPSIDVYTGSSPPMTTLEPRNLTTSNPTFTHFDGYKFPYTIVMIITIWVFFAFAYLIVRWRQKGKAMYVIPRVFVLCSPRTVQFHYELILRVGLPSPDFNPDKHDIDITVLGQTKNEIVPMTRLNTKTLDNEPLITSLSIVVYRLVEMPQLGGLILRHSGPFKSWIYAYDFTIIDLTTNKEQYFTLNQYIGSLNRFMLLREVTAANEVQYPIDDVPLPQWTADDIFLFLFTVVNCIMLIVSLMPINCHYLTDMLSVILTAFGGASIVFFLEWFFYFHMKWNQDRKDFFNDYKTIPCLPNETILKILLAIAALAIGAFCIYLTSPINDYKTSLVWLLVVIDSGVFVIGAWNICRQLDLADSIVSLGLNLRQIETICIGLKYADLIEDMRTKSGSTSEDGNSSVSVVSRLGPSRIGPRSSVKSYGFDPSGNRLLAKFALSRLSATGATPSNQTAIHNMRITHSINPSSRYSSNANLGTSTHLSNQGLQGREHTREESQGRETRLERSNSGQNKSKKESSQHAIAKNNPHLKQVQAPHPVSSEHTPIKGNHKSSNSGSMSPKDLVATSTVSTRSSHTPLSAGISTSDKTMKKT